MKRAVVEKGLLLSNIQKSDKLKKDSHTSCICLSSSLVTNRVVGSRAKHLQICDLLNFPLAKHSEKELASLYFLTEGYSQAGTRSNKW